MFFAHRANSAALRQCGELLVERIADTRSERVSTPVAPMNKHVGAATRSTYIARSSFAAVTCPLSPSPVSSDLPIAPHRTDGQPLSFRGKRWLEAIPCSERPFVRSWAQYRRLATIGSAGGQSERGEKRWDGGWVAWRLVMGMPTSRAGDCSVAIRADGARRGTLMTDWLSVHDALSPTDRLNIQYRRRPRSRQVAVAKSRDAGLTDVWRNVYI